MTSHDSYAAAAVLGAFAGDSLGLSTHWCYWAEVIAEKMGKVADLQAPGLVKFHEVRFRSLMLLAFPLPGYSLHLVYSNFFLLGAG